MLGAPKKTAAHGSGFLDVTVQDQGRITTGGLPPGPKPRTGSAPRH